MAKRQQPIPVKRPPKVTATPAKRKVLHVGCGLPSPDKLHAAFTDGTWQEIRFDINPDVEPDIVGSLTDMSKVADASMDAIWSSHNIEHLFAHEVPIALKEFYRVTREGGLVLITLPDAQKLAEYIAQGKLEDTLYKSPIGPITPLDILFGHRGKIANGNPYMAHKTAFTAATLGLRIREAGYVNVIVRRDGLNLWAIGYKVEDPSKAKNTQIQLLNINTGRAKHAPIPGREQIASGAVQQAAPPSSTAAQQKPPAPQAQPTKQQGLADELDKAPIQWKPLNLNK